MSYGIAGGLFESLESRTMLSAMTPGFKLAPLHPHASPIAVQLSPDDTRYQDGSLWGLDKIQAPLAWDQTTGTTNVTVADIDSGMDYTHRDLYLNVWLNQGEIPPAIRSGLFESPSDSDNLITFYDLNLVENGLFAQDINGSGYVDAGDLLSDPDWEDGLDNDGNSRNGYLYIDDLIGWNFAANSNNPLDGGTVNRGHGTHTAGTIGALGNNLTGVTGVNWTTQIMPLKIFGDDGSGVADTTIANAIRYSADNGAKISNNSWGGTGGVAGDALYSAIQYAGQPGRDQLFVASAGNGHWLFGYGLNNDTDASRVFPASYNLDNIISVAATDQNDVRASFSNYGLTSVDLGAPGVSILSTAPGGSYAYLSGTSMAAPHVTGVAALARSLSPSATMQEIRQAIFAGVDANASLASNGSTPTVTGGRLNAKGTLGQFVAPAAPATLAATAQSASRIDLSWSDSSLNEAGFGIERWNGSAFVQIASVGRNVTAYADTGGLAPSTPYTYRVIAYNSVGASPASPQASATTLAADAALAAPSNLKALVGSTTGINLSWLDNTDNESGFKVERSVDGGAFVTLGTLGANVVGYADTTVSPLKTYAYRVKAYRTGSPDSGYSNTATTMTAGNGTGLRGAYYDNTLSNVPDWTDDAGDSTDNLKFTRTDATVNFDWGTGSPRQGNKKMGDSDTYAVVWTGSVQPRYSQTYTFRTETDDGVGLRVNGQQIIAPVWERSAATQRERLENTSPYEGSITLEAGKKYAIEMKYYEYQGGARAKLLWRSASQAQEVIPASQLYNTVAATVSTTSATARRVFSTAPIVAANWSSMPSALGEASSRSGEEEPNELLV